ncbi:methylated-DNA--[protein]-cysteine S-methyltransferase [Aquitalea sp. S1-19]|nr:methylated-DNA--[protein]-cysteine S-methyltransferase [Aquitalea sp. S1-19]
MKHIAIDYVKTPLGELVLGAWGEQLCLCDWRYRKMRARIDARITHQLDAVMHETPTPVIELAKRQLADYFAGTRRHFELPLLMAGSDFQRRVWHALLEVPYGAKASYLALATRMGRPEAVRAVASANGANALAIIVPCHRIIGSDGELTGYAGGLEAKRKLLALESSHPASQAALFD